VKSALTFLGYARHKECSFDQVQRVDVRQAPMPSDSEIYCYKVYIVSDRHPIFVKEFGRAAPANVLARMIGEFIGTNVSEWTE
jgi:hypothetical protein